MDFRETTVADLAARVRVPESLQYPRDYNAVNVGGTVSVLEAMRDVGVQRVVLTSSHIPFVGGTGRFWAAAFYGTPSAADSSVPPTQ